MTEPIVSAPELADTTEQPLVLDCRFDLFAPDRGREQYRQGHLPGALYLHLNDDLSGQIVAGTTGRHPLPARESLRP